MTQDNDFLAEMFGRETVIENAEPQGAPVDLDHLPPSETDELENEDEEVFEDEEGALQEDLLPEDITIGYVEFLKQNNLIVLPEDLEFTGKPEDLEKIFEHTKVAREEEAIDKVFSALPEDFKPLFDYALAGGTSLKDYLSVHINDGVNDLDLTKVEDQKKIIARHYKATTEFNDEKINRLVSLISDEDDLRLEAEECYRELSTIKEAEKVALLEQAQRDRESAKQKAEQQTLALTKAVDTTSTIHPQRKQKVRSFFFDPINVEGNTTTGFNYAVQSILANPEHQAQLADILLEYNPASGFSGERLEKRFKSRAASSFQETLEKALNPKRAQKASNQKSPNSSNFDWETYSKH